MTASNEFPQDYEHPIDASEETKLTHTEKTSKSVQDADVEPDSVSDPSLNVRQGSDWTDEGGASPNGPATAESSADSSNSEELET